MKLLARPKQQRLAPSLVDLGAYRVQPGVGNVPALVDLRACQHPTEVQLVLLRVTTPRLRRFPRAMSY